MPNTVPEWKEIVQRFEDKWNFPHCLGVLKCTDFFKKVNNGQLNLSPSEPVLDDVTTNLSYVFVGDEAFAL